MKMQRNATFAEKTRKRVCKRSKSSKSQRPLAFTGKYGGAAHSICTLRFNVPNEIPIVLHNGSNYDYHFIIRQLAKESEGKFECLGVNTKKCKLLL